MIIVLLFMIVLMALRFFPLVGIRGESMLPAYQHGDILFSRRIFGKKECELRVLAESIIAKGSLYKRTGDANMSFHDAMIVFEVPLLSKLQGLEIYLPSVQGFKQCQRNLKMLNLLCLISRKNCTEVDGMYEF